MDLWQSERQFAYLLGVATWEDAPSAVVLTGGAVVSPDGPGNFLATAAAFLPGGGPTTLSLPFAVVAAVDSRPNGDHPNRAEVRLRALVVAGGGGVTDTGTSTDDHGTEATTGGTRATTQGQGQSTGRGLDEIFGRLREGAFPTGLAIESTHGFRGSLARVAHSAQQATGSKIVCVDGSQIVARAFDLVIDDATDTRHYHAVRRLKATNGTGQITLNWTAPPTRYDTLGYVLRRASGSTPPSTISSGTGVTVTAGASSVVDTVAAGAYAYSLWVTYDETSDTPTTADRYSAPVTATGTAA